MKFILSALLLLSTCATPALAQTVTDGSGTITTGGSSQQVFPVAIPRQYLFCQNPITATETLFVNVGAPASVTSGSYELAAGGSLTFSGGPTNSQPFVPVGVVTVAAATAGHRFICKQG